MTTNDGPQALLPCATTGQSGVDHGRRVITNHVLLLHLIRGCGRSWVAGFERCFEIDLGDVSSLDYYTGLSLKFVTGAGTSVGRGGRYDRLIASFGREPAIGFVLNLDALTEVAAAHWFARSNENGSVDDRCRYQLCGGASTKGEQRASQIEIM